MEEIMRKSVLKIRYSLLLGSFLLINSLAYSQSQYNVPQQNQNYNGSSCHRDNPGSRSDNYNQVSDNYRTSSNNRNSESYNQSTEDYYRARPGDYDNRDPLRRFDPEPDRTGNGQILRFPNYSDWDYQESWRDNRKAYYSGETQAEAYRKNHPYGEGGIGYDPDPVYLRMEEEYRLLRDQDKQGGGSNRQSNKRYDDDYYNRIQGRDGSRIKYKTKGNYYRERNYES